MSNFFQDFYILLRNIENLNLIKIINKNVTILCLYCYDLDKNQDIYLNNVSKNFWKILLDYYKNEKYENKYKGNEFEIIIK